MVRLGLVYDGANGTVEVPGYTAYTDADGKMCGIVIQKVAEKDFGKPSGVSRGGGGNTLPLII